MHITFSPMRRDGALLLERHEDILVVNGEPFDFGPLPEGATLPSEAISSDLFAKPVKRVDGVLHITLVLPHGANAPSQTLFPAPIIDPANGTVTVPPYSAPPEEDTYA